MSTWRMDRPGAFDKDAVFNKELKRICCKHCGSDLLKPTWRKGRPGAPGTSSDLAPTWRGFDLARLATWRCLTDLAQGRPGVETSDLALEATWRPTWQKNATWRAWRTLRPGRLQ